MCFVCLVVVCQFLNSLFWLSIAVFLAFGFFRMLKLWNYEAFVLLSCLVITIYETTATNIYKGIAVILLRLCVASHKSGCPSRAAFERRILARD